MSLRSQGGYDPESGIWKMVSPTARSRPEAHPSTDRKTALSTGCVGGAQYD